MTLPPWRDTAAQLSKWQPRRSIDEDWEGGGCPSNSSGSSGGRKSVDMGALDELAVARRHREAVSLFGGDKLSQPRVVLARHSPRSASQVVTDTSSPRPSKTQRLSAAAAAAATGSKVGTGWTSEFATAAPRLQRLAPFPPLFDGAEQHSFRATSPSHEEAFTACGPTATPIVHSQVAPDSSDVLRPFRKVSCRGTNRAQEKGVSLRTLSPDDSASCWRAESMCCEYEGPKRGHCLDVDQGTICRVGSEFSDGSDLSDSAAFTCSDPDIRCIYLSGSL